MRMWMILAVVLCGCASDDPPAWKPPCPDEWSCLVAKQYAPECAAECKAIGRCVLMQGVCAAISDFDCRWSDACRDSTLPPDEAPCTAGVGIYTCMSYAEALDRCSGVPPKNTLCLGCDTGFHSEDGHCVSD